MLEEYSVEDRLLRAVQSMYCYMRMGRQASRLEIESQSGLGCLGV